MGTFSDSVRAATLDAWLGGQAPALPANVEFGLSSTRPNDDGTGVTEPAGNGYARPSYANDLTTWAATTGDVKANAIDITFPEVTEVDDLDGWGDLGYWQAYDAATHAFLLWGRLGAMVHPLAGDIPTWGPGTLTTSSPGSA